MWHAPVLVALLVGIFGIVLATATLKDAIAPAMFYFFSAASILGGAVLMIGVASAPVTSTVERFVAAVVIALMCYLLGYVIGPRLVSWTQLRR